MAWCAEHDCPESMCFEYQHAEDRAIAAGQANYNAAVLWKRRAEDMKRRLDAIQGGSAEWIDVIERQSGNTRSTGQR